MFNLGAADRRKLTTQSARQAQPIRAGPGNCLQNIPSTEFNVKVIDISLQHYGPIIQGNRAFRELEATGDLDHIHSKLPG